MERGYFKVWRKIEDSQSYNRSALHRALLLTIFVKANWKEGYFCGQKILPGQIAASLSALSEELRESRTTVTRALRDLEKDEVVKLENVGNRWTRITLVNWDCYQQSPGKDGQPADNRRSTDGQPADNHRSTDGRPMDNHRSTTGQPVDTIKEVKKESIKNPPHSPPTGGGLADPPDSTAEAKTPSYSPEFELFWEAYPKKRGKEAAFKAWEQRRKKRELPELSELLVALGEAKRTHDWQKEGGRYVPHPATWLNQGRWADDYAVEAEDDLWAGAL